MQVHSALRTTDLTAGARHCCQALTSLAEDRPTFKFAGAKQPGWGYASPLNAAVVWFSAEQSVPLSTPLSFDSFVTQAGA